MVINVDSSSSNVLPLHCDQCGVSNVPLYIYHANGRGMTLCLACIQNVVWSVAQKKPGPSEVKHIGVNPYD